MSMDHTRPENLDDSSSGNDDDDSLDVSSSKTDGSSARAEMNDDVDKDNNILAKRETVQVKWLKVMVVAVLLFAAALVATAVYLYTKRSETAEFEGQFNEQSNKVLESIGISLEVTFEALDSLAVSIVAAAAQSNQTFPFITIPDFALQSIRMLASSALVFVMFLPVVDYEQRLQWEAYSAIHGREWVDDVLRIQATDPTASGLPINYSYLVRDAMFGIEGFVPYNISKRPFLPTWQTYPVAVNFWPYNFDYLTQSYSQADYACVDDRSLVLSDVFMLPDPNVPQQVEEAAATADFYQNYLPPGEDALAPASDILFPVFISRDSARVNTSSHATEAVLTGTIYWRDMIRNILPPGSDGIVVVFENPCTPSFTYMLKGPQVEYLGRGDLHNPKYDSLGLVSSIFDLNRYRIRRSKYAGPPLHDTFCPFSFHVYPSDVMESDYVTNKPIIYTLAVVFIFIFAALVFAVYDYTVERRQRIVMNTAKKSSAVVSSLFPATVRDRLYEETGVIDEKKALSSFAKSQAKQVAFSGHGTVGHPFSGSPIAELYTSTTVMFADIAGFTAWSSVRSPSEVFTLLEAVYAAFDEIARQRGVFKVETIGDSYVAVCGLPVPRKKHAVVMAKFAADCRAKMNELTQILQTTLGPGTADLAFRFGLNSGPTTAGVLRGEKSRFQLFGDTVNTAARMESTGEKNRIHASQKTADLLVQAGKESWVKVRSDSVNVRGKGAMTTYWVEPILDRQSTSEVSAPSTAELSDVYRETHRNQVDAGCTQPTRDSHIEHLLAWNTEALESLLKIIVAHHQCKRENTVSKELRRGVDLRASRGQLIGNPRDSITEVLDIQPVEPSAAIVPAATAEVELSDEAKEELRDLVSTIAYLHKNNPFHNFDHASHVLMSTRKLLSRIVKRAARATAAAGEAGNGHSSHSCTFGITADPLVPFSLAFAALIHDLDHPGVSNVQLAKERAPVALAYQNLSVSEQNSLSVAWNLLMQPQYSNLRACIYQDEKGEQRFRQLLVNVVMATDIFDKDLKLLREARWAKAFPTNIEECSAPQHQQDLSWNDSKDEIDRRATIVIEYIIQASDVSHTMQHWTVYQKWNKRLFREMRLAYKNGRSERDPGEFWYEGEIWFFDNYIIPLAQKLKQCGVFGVSCDEFLDYARDNRLEWEAKGKELVDLWIAEEDSCS